MQLLVIVLPSTLNASLINVQNNKLLVEPDTVQNEKIVGKQESERLKKRTIHSKKDIGKGIKDTDEEVTQKKKTRKRITYRQGRYPLVNSMQ